MLGAGVEQCVDTPGRGTSLCRDPETGKSMVNFWICVCVCACLEYTQLGEVTPNKRQHGRLGSHQAESYRPQ